MTTRIKNYRQHAAKRARALLPNPHVRESQLNKTGIELTPAEYRKVAAAVDRLNRGEGFEFDTAGEAIAHIRARAARLRR
jgi:hypothetical protein